MTEDEIFQELLGTTPEMLVSLGVSNDEIAQMKEAVQQVKDAVQADLPTDERLSQLEMQVEMAGICIDKLTEGLLTVQETLQLLASRFE